MENGDESILLIDDEEANVQVFAKVLKWLSYSVSSFSNSIEAFEVLKVNPESYDLMLTGLNMPEISEYELAKKMQDYNLEQPVVLMTGFSHGIDRSTFEEVNIRHVIQKPVSVATLASALRKVLDRNKQLKIASVHIV